MSTQNAPITPQEMAQLLYALCPKTKRGTLDSYAWPLVKFCNEAGITTPKRLSAFLAQIIHESGGLNYTKENLNYSADGLRKVFGKYFPTEQLALEYARRPEKIANRVYANRMGNGNEASGDGWAYRGRGLIQLTGKDSYMAFLQTLPPEDRVPAYLETPVGAAESSVWFWTVRGLNRYADNGDFVGLTKRINGGTNGLEDRRKYYNMALAYFESKTKSGK